MTQSTQHKLDSVRSPRVQITYDVEIGNATEKKELPFVIGVISDLAGESKKVNEKLKDRRFIEIDRDNFNQVMSSIEPTISLNVANKIDQEKATLPISLSFTNMDSFHPYNIGMQVPAIKELLEARQLLFELSVKMEMNPNLAEKLSGILRNSEKMQYLIENK